MEFSKNKITSKEFIGREGELKNVKDLLAGSVDGNGTLLMIEGEAGIGKTRLIDELVNQSKDLDIQYLRGRCKYHQGLDPYSPFIEALRNWFGLDEITSEHEKDQKEIDRIGQIIRTKSPELIGIIPLIRGFVSSGTTIYGSYLFKGSNINKSFNTFKELISQKKSGLCITREHPDEVKGIYDLENTNMYWLTKSSTDIPTLDPSQIEKIRWTIKDFISENKNSVVLVDGLEYLILQNNFENVLKFVELLKDDIALNNAVLILPINPDTLEERQMALLERYMRVISSDSRESIISQKVPKRFELSIPEYSSESHPIRPIDMDYLAEKDKMFEALLQLFKNITSKKTLILFLDDLNWADYSSLQLLQYLLQNAINDKILIIGAFRPEDLPEENNLIEDLFNNIKKLNLQSRFSRIKLDRMTINDVNQLVKNILDQDVSDRFINLIFKKSEGNPLYVEEILKSLLNDNTLNLKDKTWHKDLDYSKIEIPNSITEVVQMRLDRVAKDNEMIDQILKYSSIIGSTFNFDILLQALPIDEELLLDNIEKLMKANIIHEVGVDKYKFDHTFIREVVYNNLGSRRKKILHAKIGNSIEELYQSNLLEYYPQLAYHFSMGGVIDKAVDYSTKEGENAKELCAYDESLFHYRSALEMASQDSNLMLNQNLLINLHINLGDLSLILGSWADAKNYFEKALEISKKFGDDVKKVESRSKLDEIEIKKQRWSLAVKKLQEVLDIKLDDKESNILLVTIKPKYVIRANISLIEILLKENLEGVYICINHPSYLIDKVLKVHQMPTQNLLYLDFITPLAGRTSTMVENVYMTDNVFSLDNLLEAMNIDSKDLNKKVNFDIKNIDFIMVDNISNLIAYTTSEKILQFIEALVKIIKKLTATYGIVIMDDESSPEVKKLMEHYFDKSVTIKEEWL